MKKLFYSVFALAALFTSCDEENAVVLRDYGMKTYEADMAYDGEASHGEVSYKEQTYFGFKANESVGSGSYGDNDWTDYNLYTESEEYNVTAPSSIEGWNLLTTTYIDPIDMGGTIYPYLVSGVLINTETVAGVAMNEYAVTELTEVDEVSEAFTALSAGDDAGLTYDNSIDVIGYAWKSVDMETGLYEVSSNHFYFIKLVNGDVYKLRFTGFHGNSADERIVKFEYALLNEDA